VCAVNTCGSIYFCDGQASRPASLRTGLNSSQGSAAACTRPPSATVARIHHGSPLHSLRYTMPRPEIKRTLKCNSATDAQTHADAHARAHTHTHTHTNTHTSTHTHTHTRTRDTHTHADKQGIDLVVVVVGAGDALLLDALRALVPSCAR
jgi:hypothetical protein